MSDKRKKLKFAAKREKRRVKKAADARPSKNGPNIPVGAILADKSQQVPNNSYSPPPEYYIDKEFTCIDCGCQEVWTAEQQKWYYEVAKGLLYATAVRCRDCRRKHAERHQGHGDPNPIKHVGTLMKRIRIALEPWLREAGFVLEGRSSANIRRYAWLDYSRPGLILRLLFDHHDVSLIAEAMDDKSECKIVARVELSSVNGPPPTATFLDRIDQYTSNVQEFLRNLPDMNRPSHGTGA